MMMSLRSSPMLELTEDLVEEILTRVPATSLKRLRSTCNIWNTLFNDRRFTKKHSDKAEKQYFDLLFWKDRLSRMTVNLHGLQGNTDPSAIEIKGELSVAKFLNNSGDVIEINDELSLAKFHNNSDDVIGIDNEFTVSHCNGFLLCTNTWTTLVWNPCTDQTKLILTKSANMRFHEYALGYANKKSCHDYKILRFLRTANDVEIFEFNTDSWKVSGTVNSGFEFINSGGVSVKGNTYWIAFEDDKSSFLISFDFTTESFGPRMCLPFQGNSHVRRMPLYSVREERLSLLFQNKDASNTEIWMTNDIIETNVLSWSKFLRFDFKFTRRFTRSTSFFIVEEKKFAVVLSEYKSHDDGTYYLLVYIIGEDRCRIVNLGNVPRCVLAPRLFSYAPSLVRI